MNLTKKFQIKIPDKKRYVFVEKRDYKILAKIYQLEKLNLDKYDKEFVKFIRTQLKRDWRKPILQELNGLLKKYKT